MDKNITESGFKEINWNSKYIPICESIIKDLQDKDLTFLHAYYWQGKTEDEIVPVLDLSCRQDVELFKKRVFARCRMYLTKQSTFIPLCLKYDLKQYSRVLFNLSQRLRRKEIIERMENDVTFRHTIQDLVVELIKYIKDRDCRFCENRNRCEKSLKKHNTECKIMHKVLNIEDYTLEKNLKNQKKLLEYLLSWKVFNASN
jgi:hypothetical protein